MAPAMREEKSVCSCVSKMVITNIWFEHGKGEETLEDFN